jgi:O-antigen ligase
MSLPSFASNVVRDRQLYLFCALFFALPVSTKITSWCMWAVAAVWILDPQLLKKLKTTFTNRVTLIYLLPFFLLAVTLLYTDDLKAGTRSLENKIFLILFPIVLCTFDYTVRKIRILLQAFVASIITWALVCLAIGIYAFLTVEVKFDNIAGDYYNRVVSPWHFISNIQLVQPIDISPIYMSAMTGLAIIFTVELLGKEENKFAKWIWIGSIVFLFVFNILLGARMGLISLIIALPFYFVFNFGDIYKKFARRIAIGITVAIGLLVVLFVFNPVLQKRFGKDMMNMSYPKDVSGWNSVNIRNAVWHCSVEAVKQKPLLGYGLGSEHVERESCYRQFSFYGPFGTDLNSHNQYLEYLLIGGVLLLAGLLANLGTSFFYAWKTRSGLLTAFTVFMALNFVTESFLAVQKGIIIYSLFIVLLTFGSVALNDRRVSI